MAYNPRYGTVNREYGMHLATMSPEADGPVYMVNLMKYRTVASYADDNAAQISGKEADDLYSPTDILREIGAEVPFFGEVELQTAGDDVVWDRIGVVKYPTRRSFIDMQSRKDFRGKHEHKEAGMEFTFCIGCLPTEASNVPSAGDSTSVVHPSTDDDGPVVVLDVIKYDESGATEAAANNAASLSHGGSPIAWLDVEGTIMGDGRSWDAVRFTSFPSLRAFQAAADDHTRVAHGERAISDSYTMVIRPTINRFTI